MKKRIFGLISILVGVVLSLAALEVVAIAWMQIEDGHYTPAAELGRTPSRLGWEQDRRRSRRDFVRAERTTGRHSHAPRFFCPAAHLRERRSRSRGVSPKIEDTQRTRPAQRGS